MSASSALRSLPWFLAVAPLTIAAQQPAPGRGNVARDTLRLGRLHDEALRADPRQRELQLQSSQARLRLRNIAAGLLPSITGQGQGQYQSPVTSIALSLPGVRIPTPPHNTYDAHVGAEQSLFDPTLAPRRGVERALLAESQAQLRVTLFGLRQEVNESFFAAASLQQRAAELGATISDLDARLSEAARRVREGASLPSDTSTIEATLLQRRQDSIQVSADRRAALARLSALTAHAIIEADILATPDLAVAVAHARGMLDSVRARPEYAQFASTRARLARQAAVDAAQEQPRLSAFARAGYGKPGLNVLSTSFSSYWLAGVQLQWAPWNWGTVDREREVLALQQEIVAADEAAFTNGLQRNVQSDLATIDRLDSALALDDRIIALREQIERETRFRLQERAATASEYVDKTTDLLSARLTRDEHRVSLAQARAHFLTTLGIEVR